MPERTIFVDASVFLGMHHRNESVRQESLAFFCQQYVATVTMNYEQVGICDAIIWQQSRAVQDHYYPFMDRLHTDMAITRAGYSFHEISTAATDARLRHLLPEQALLASQVLGGAGLLATHDPALRTLPCLAGHLWTFDAADPLSSFPPELQCLYEASKVFVHGGPQGAWA